MEDDMRHGTFALVVAGCVLALGLPTVVAAQSGPAELQGAWTIQDVSNPRPPANPRNNPTGLVQFAGSHFSMMATQDSSRPALPDGGAAKATADQLRATWGPLVANAGTFTVTGSTIRLANMIAKGPVASGNFAEWSFTLKGDSLTMTQVRNQNGPVANPVTLRLTRAK
jgi:hypothetical protein